MGKEASSSPEAPATMASRIASAAEDMGRCYPRLASAGQGSPVGAFQDGPVL